MIDFIDSKTSQGLSGSGNSWQTAQRRQAKVVVKVMEVVNRSKSCSGA